MDRRIVLQLLCVAWLFCLPACISYRTYEFDVSQVEEFKWSGKVRITERTEESGVLSRSKSTKAQSFVLLGKDGPDIVVRPSIHANSNGPIAHLDYKGIDPADLINYAVLRDEFPILVELTQANSKTATHEVGNIEQPVMDAFMELAKNASRLQNHEYDKLTGTQAVLAASCSDLDHHVTYMLNDGSTMQVIVNNAKPESLTVIIRDGNGKVIHRYDPVEFDVHEILSHQP